MKKKTNKNSNKRLAALLTILVFLATGFLVILAKQEEIATSLAIRFYGGSSQCVAFVQRYYDNMFDIKIENVGRAQNLFSMAGSFGLYAHENGGTIAPQPGDILVFGSNNKTGHVAIITEVFNDGVKIIEQNWGTSVITTNGNQPIRMGAYDGRFFIANRDNYWTIGWVSRTEKNPANFFLFSDGRSEGWYPDGNVFQEKNSDGFKARVTGRHPMIASPVFIANQSIKRPDKIEMRMKIENKSEQKGLGHLFLRDQHGEWSQDIPFAIDVNKDFQLYTFNLDNLPEDFELSQIRLQLNDNPQIRNEFWNINWLRIYRTSSLAFF